MRILTLLLLLVALDLQAGLQFTGNVRLTGNASTGVATNAPAGGSEMNPTNGMGATAYAWWEPSRGYATNGGVPTLPNLTSLGALLDLTNKTSPWRLLARS